MLAVYIDFKSPASYLALEPTVALADRLGLALAWHPFRTHERDIPGQGVDKSVARSHHRVRAEARRAIHIRYARLRGLELEFPPVPHQSDLALGVLCLLTDDPVDYIRAAFAAYWESHLDLDAEEVVRDLIRSTGASHSGTLSSARTALDMAQERAEDAGVVDAPAYVIGGEVFVGRQHLPWIEELAAPKV